MGVEGREGGRRELVDFEVPAVGFISSVVGIMGTLRDGVEEPADWFSVEGREDSVLRLDLDMDSVLLFESLGSLGMILFGDEEGEARWQDLKCLEDLNSK